MKNLFAIILSTCALGASAQELHMVWNKFIGGANNCNALSNYGIATADKGILFVGRSNCNGSGDLPPTTAMQQGDNVLVGKLDSNANIEWVKIFGGTEEDEAFAACQTLDGGYAVLAETRSPDGDVIGFKGSRDLWVIRLDAQGDMLWNKCYGSATSSDQALSIAATSENGLLILGAANGAGDDIPFHYGGGFTFDWLLIKTDSQGNKIWSKTLGGSDDEMYSGSIVEANNGYYLAGGSTSTDYDCNDTSWHPSSYNSSYDVYLLYLDTSGNLLWRKSYGGTQSDIAFNAIWDDRDSSIAMICKTSSSDYMVNSNGAERAWIVKTDKNGNLMWEKAAGIDGEVIESLPMSICKADNQGYLAYTHIHSVIGQRDGFLIAIDSIGNSIAKVFGSIKSDRVGSIIQYKQGFAAVGTSSSLGFTEGTNIGGYLPANAFISYIDYFPAKVNSASSRNSISIFPNPAKDRLYIGSGGHNIKGVGLYDMSGRLIDEPKLMHGHEVLLPPGLATGPYLLELQMEDGVEVLEFVKE